MQDWMSCAKNIFLQKGTIFMTLKDRLTNLQKEAKKSPEENLAYLNRFNEACRDLYLTIKENWLNEEINSEPPLIEPSELIERKFDPIKGEFLAISLYLQLPNSNFIILEPLQAFSAYDFGSIHLKGSVSARPKQTSILFRENDLGKGAIWKVRNQNGKRNEPNFTKIDLERHLDQWL